MCNLHPIHCRCMRCIYVWDYSTSKTCKLFSHSSIQTLVSPEAGIVNSIKIAFQANLTPFELDNVLCLPSVLAQGWLGCDEGTLLSGQKVPWTRKDYISVGSNVQVPCHMWYSSSHLSPLLVDGPSTVVRFQRKSADL